MMQNIYEKSFLISSAYVDQQCELGLYQSVLLLQDAVTELFYSLGCDALRMCADCGCVWAVVRSKLVFHSLPMWMDTVTLRVWPVKVSPLTVHVEFMVSNAQGETLLQGRQELCPVDCREHTVCRMKSTTFPIDLPLLPPVLITPFRREKLELDREDLRCRHTILASDTDMNHHLNNVSYIRLLQNAWPMSYWDTHFVSEFDIQYVSEGLEGEELSILSRETEEGLVSIVQNGERILAKAFFRIAEKVPRFGCIKAENPIH